MKSIVYAEEGVDPTPMYDFGYEYFYDFEYIANLIKTNNTPEE